MKIKEFREGLSTGAYVVEKAVLERLYRNYGLKFEGKEI